MKKFKTLILGLSLILIAFQICAAKNLYVSTTGSDSNSYSSNGIDHPWRTVEHAWATAEDGDIVYYRRGTYTIRSKIDNENSGSGVTHTNYQSESVTWESSLCNDHGVIMVTEDNVTVDGINGNWTGAEYCFADTGFFNMGWATNKSGSADGFTLKNGVWAFEKYGQNGGLVFSRLNGSDYAEDVTIENVKITGPGAGDPTYGSINTSGIMMFQAQNWTIRNCEISNVNTGMFYNKHANAANSNGGIVQNNYIHNVGTAIRTQANNTTFDNNIFDGAVRTGYDSGPSADGNIGSDNLTWTHNTFLGEVDMEDNTRAGDNALVGTVYPVFQNNILVGRNFRIHQYGSAPTYYKGDYNLWLPDGTIYVYDGRSSSAKTLTTFREFLGGCQNSDNECNSIEQIPIFEGGSSPTTIEGYALVRGSFGENAASDGSDIGANVSLIGFGNSVSSSDPVPGGGDIVDNSVPATPSISFVELEIEIPSNPSIIFQDDFDGSASMQSKYYSYNDHDGDCVVQDSVGLGNSRGLRAHWETGQIDAGGFWYMFGRNPVTSLSHSSSNFENIYWRFYLRTSQGWTGGNPAKLTRATVFSAQDWSQAMIAHVWGNLGEEVLKLDPASCVVGGEVVSSGYNDFSAIQWLGAGVGTTPIYSQNRSNIWHFIECHVQLNTLGQSNGVFEVWVDGNLELSQQNLNFRGTWSEYGINAIAFSNYWNGGAASSQNRYLDNLVISTSPIGPSHSPVNPTIQKTVFIDSDSNDEQSRFQVQICTAADGSGIVWTGEVASNSANTIRVDNSYGTFGGVLSGSNSLEDGEVYYARVRQADRSGDFSDWSSFKMFKTALTRPTLRVIDPN